MLKLERKATNHGYIMAMDQQPKQPEQVIYVCVDCGEENTLKFGDVFQCKECGYRILHKKCTRKCICAGKCTCKYTREANQFLAD